MARRSKADERHSRAFYDECAAAQVLSVIKHGLNSDVWRHDLMEAHFRLVYDFAHYENDQIDFYLARPDIRLNPEAVSSRIIARNAAELARAAQFAEA